MQLGKAVTIHYHTLLDNGSPDAAGALVAELVEQDLDQIREMRLQFTDDLLVACNQYRHQQNDDNGTADHDGIVIQIDGHTYNVDRGFDSRPAVLDATTLTHEGHVDDDSVGIEEPFQLNQHAVAILTLPYSE